MVIVNIISIFILNYLRKNGEVTEGSEKWFKNIKIGIGIAVALIILDKSDLMTGGLQGIFSILLFGGIAYIAYLIPEFNKGQILVYAISPYVLINSISHILKSISADLYETIDVYVGGAAFFALIWAVSIWWSARKQKKALEIERIKALARDQEIQITQNLKNQLEVQVAERTAELTRQKEELQLTINELKSTQAQLIHAEKMASLGELTAGIAHEIQNPLNFVNNFSEVTDELIEEIRESRAKRPKKGARSEEDELEDEILEDIKSNLKKIIHHGKRADGIVKGMLQHSRSDSGTKQLTDINELADEFMRLSYHGLRAKDKSFNADFKMDFDPSVPKLNVAPQDIGRVFLNLINNAFYAVNSHKIACKESDTGYKPEVNISTKNLGGKVQIVVADNGPGIPLEIQSKIFQPFFTTKPTGQGTGLGLSLSYDIIKAHGGEIKIKSEQEKGTQFQIELPI